MKRQTFCVLILLAAVTAGCSPTESPPTATPRPAPTPSPTPPPPTSTPVPLPPVDVPILMYHKVGPTAHTVWWVTADLFARQMDALLAYGYKTVTLQDYINHREGLASLPDHPVIITFDDGYQNLYTEAYPILKERGMTATAFIPTSKIAESAEERKDNSWDAPEAPYPANHLIWEEVQALYEAGFAIESHTVSHPLLEQISKNWVERELVDSRKELQDRLGHDVYFLCYPYSSGAYDAEIQSQVSEAGYRAAVAAYPDGVANTATSNIWSLPRMTVSEDHSVVVNPERPDDFFMRRVDPDFPVPIITIDQAAYQGEGGATGEVFHPGDTVTIAVTTSNDGDPANVQATLRLDDDADHSTFYYEETLAGSIERGETETFEFVVTLPGDVSPGPHYRLLAFQDDYLVLWFLLSDWEEAFAVAE